MKYLKTTKATNWPLKESWSLKLLRNILFFIPKANPSYDHKMHLIKRWLIEFVDTDGELLPWREIALDSNDNVIFAGPDKSNYGFWLDTNMKYEDFNDESIEKEEFERYWNMCRVKAID